MHKSFEQQCQMVFENKFRILRIQLSQNDKLRSQMWQTGMVFAPVLN